VLARKLHNLIRVVAHGAFGVHCHLGNDRAVEQRRSDTRHAVGRYGFALPAAAHYDAPLTLTVGHSPRCREHKLRVIIFGIEMGRAIIDTFVTETFQKRPQLL
jgi:hypothetical protein